MSGGHDFSRAVRVLTIGASTPEETLTAVPSPVPDSAPVLLILSVSPRAAG